MSWHHFTWLLYLVICHLCKNCSTRLKISEMTIYSSHLYFWIFIWSTILTYLRNWIFIVAMWSGVKPCSFLWFTQWKNPHDKAGLTPLHLATSLCKFETFVLQFVLHFVFLFCCHKFNTHGKHDCKVKFRSFFITIRWYCQYPQSVKQLGFIFTNCGYFQYLWFVTTKLQITTFQWYFL